VKARRLLTGARSTLDPRGEQAWVRLLNDLVIGAHTDVTVRLSATLPECPGQSLVCNVHGVRAEFLAVGAAAGQRDGGGKAEAGGWPMAGPSGAYFLGKALYTKGYRELIEGLLLHDPSEAPAIDTWVLPEWNPRPLPSPQPCTKWNQAQAC
jgi:hypothetical protein